MIITSIIFRWNTRLRCQSSVLGWTRRTCDMRTHVGMGWYLFKTQVGMGCYLLRTRVGMGRYLWPKWSLWDEGKGNIPTMANLCSLLTTSEECAPRKGPRRHGIKVLNIEIARPITLKVRIFWQLQGFWQRFSERVDIPCEPSDSLVQSRRTKFWETCLQQCLQNNKTGKPEKLVMCDLDQEGSVIPNDFHSGF